MVTTKACGTRATVEGMVLAQAMVAVPAMVAVMVEAMADHLAMVVATTTVAAMDRLLLHTAVNSMVVCIKVVGVSKLHKSYWV